MALKPQASFSGGELDPALSERTNLQKYDSALKTARNVIIGKTGRVLSRAGRKNLQKTKNNDERVVIFAIPKVGVYLEWGHLYVRVYSTGETITAGLVFEAAHDFVEADLPALRFKVSGPYVYIFCLSKEVKKLFWGPGGGFTASANIFFAPPAPTLSQVVSNGTGYNRDYRVTAVVNGQESDPSNIIVAKIPINVGEQAVLAASLGVDAGNTYTEMRVYARPSDGGIFGYIGSSSNLIDVGLTIESSFVDFGQEADFGHNPPELEVPISAITGRGAITDPINYRSKTGVIYQQRLVLVTSSINAQGMISSRPGYENNFYRDFPLNAASALLFKAGAEGNSEVLELIEQDGLIVFTKTGVFYHTGALTPENISFQEKGGWLLDDRVTPVKVPDGFLFIDKASNVVRHLAWSTEYQKFTGEETSIFSNHLFEGRRINSWAFHEGPFPHLIVTFTDKTLAMFTYEKDHEMRAWTRGESIIDVEQAAGTGVADQSLILVAKDNAGVIERYVEITVPRYVSGDTADADPQWRMNESMAAMDSMVTQKDVLNEELVGADEITITAVSADDWEAHLNVDCGTSGIFTNTPGRGQVGTILRVFDSDDAPIDLEVTAHLGDNQITVQPSRAFPQEMSIGSTLYATFVVVTGLTHLEDESVAVIADGNLIASPLNDVDVTPLIEVDGGQITLEERAAIVHVGRPYAMDVGMLEIATVEQRPVLIESQTVNKVYVKVHKSRGLYIGPKFGADDGVKDMEQLDSQDVGDGETELEIIGNNPRKPFTRRVEVSIQGDWKINGAICLRQPDPLHFEILSVIPDVNDLRRSR